MASVYGAFRQRRSICAGVEFNLVILRTLDVGTISIDVFLQLEGVRRLIKRFNDVHFVI